MMAIAYRTIALTCSYEAEEGQKGPDRFKRTLYHSLALLLLLWCCTENGLVDMGGRSPASGHGMTPSCSVYTSHN